MDDDNKSTLLAAVSAIAKLIEAADTESGTSEPEEDLSW